MWVGNDGVVCVERGHLRDEARLGELMDELVALAALIAAGAEGAVGTPRKRGESHKSAEREPAQEPARAAQQAAFEIAPAASADPGDVLSFIQACFDRRVAAYEVNRRIHKEWIGRRVHGSAILVRRDRLGGHDFDFADLKGFRVELHVKGPEEFAPLVRVNLQVEESRRKEVEAVAAGQPVRFDGQLLAANPLLYNLQLVAASVTPGR